MHIWKYISIQHHESFLSYALGRHQGMACAKLFFLKSIFYLHIKGAAVLKIRSNYLFTISYNYYEAVYSSCVSSGDYMLQKWFAGYGEHDFRPINRERPHPAAFSGCQNYS